MPLWVFRISTRAMPSNGTFILFSFCARYFRSGPSSADEKKKKQNSLQKRKKKEWSALNLDRPCQCRLATAANVTVNATSRPFGSSPRDNGRHDLLACVLAYVIYRFNPPPFVMLMLPWSIHAHGVERLPGAAACDEGRYGNNAGDLLQRAKPMSNKTKQNRARNRRWPVSCFRFLFLFLFFSPSLCSPNGRCAALMVPSAVCRYRTAILGPRKQGSACWTGTRQWSEFPRPKNTPLRERVVIGSKLDSGGEEWDF